MPHCWSYARTSTTRQAGGDKSGMGRQEEALARWLADHPTYHLQEALVDPGVSAGRGKHRTRGALSRFIAAARAGDIPPGSALVVESMTRLSREVATDALAMLLELWTLDLAISFCTDGVVLDKALIDREDHRLHGVVGAIGQARREWEERSRRSRGAAAKTRQLQDQGHRVGGRTPWWIARDDQGALVRDRAGGMVVDPDHSRSIQRAVELAIGGMGMVLIAQQLADEGFSPPPTSWAKNGHRDRRKPAWTAGIVSRTLSHPSLTGTLERKGGPAVVGYYPPVITAEEHLALRASIERRNRMKGRLRGSSSQCRNLFQGVIRCAVCDGPISYISPAKRSRRGHPGYVGCHAARRGINCTNKGITEYDGIETHCLTRLRSSDWEALLRRPEDDAGQLELEREVSRLTMERDRLQGQLDAAQIRAQAAWLEGATEARVATIEGAIEKLKATLQGVQTDLAGAEQQLAIIRARPTGRDAAGEMMERVSEFWLGLRQASPAERLSFNRWLLSRDPAIQFLLHPGQRIELLVGGVSQGVKPLEPEDRLAAVADGFIDPIIAGSGITSRDADLSFLTPEQRQNLEWGTPEERLEIDALVEAEFNRQSMESYQEWQAARQQAEQETA